MYKLILHISLFIKRKIHFLFRAHRECSGLFIFLRREPTRDVVRRRNLSDLSNWDSSSAVNQKRQWEMSQIKCVTRKKSYKSHYFQLTTSTMMNMNFKLIFSVIMQTIRNLMFKVHVVWTLIVHHWILNFYCWNPLLLALDILIWTLYTKNIHTVNYYYTLFCYFFQITTKCRVARL